MIHETRRGVLAMSAGMACFMANDALVKLASQVLPASQIIFVRGLFATSLLLAMAWYLGTLGNAPMVLDKRVVARATLDAVATFAYLTSLFHLPIALATAINMASPLIMMLLATLLLRERMAPGRWVAVGVGFLGVLFVVQPSTAGVDGFALLCIAATALHAGRDLVTRSIDRRVPSILVTLATAAAVTVLAGLWSLFQPWAPMNARQLALLGAASVFLATGYFLVTVSMRGGDLSVIAAFRYTALLFAMLLGYMFWGDVPDTLAWAGIALLVGSGLHVLGSNRKPAPVAEAPSST